MPSTKKKAFSKNLKYEFAVKKNLLISFFPETILPVYFRNHLDLEFISERKLEEFDIREIRYHVHSC